MREPTKDIASVSIDSQCVALVNWLYSQTPGPSGEWISFTMWLEVRYLDGNAVEISDVTKLATVFKNDSIRSSVLADPTSWALIMSCIQSIPIVLRERKPCETTYAFRSINIQEMSPWVDKEYLYFLTIESIINSPEASILAFRMRIDSFALEHRTAASIADLQSGDVVWNYSQKDIVSLFESEVAVARA